MTLQLNKNRPTEISFDLEIEGLTTSYLSSVDVRFNLLHEGHNISITANRNNDKTYNVLVPVVENCQIINKFNIEVITQGYYFKPLEDAITWVDTVEKVHITPPTVIKPQSEQIVDTQPKQETPQEVVNSNQNPKHDVGFVFANNTREFNFVDLDKLPKGTIGEEPPTSKQETTPKKPEYLGKKETTPVPKKDQQVEKPAPTTQPKHVSDEEKVQRLRGVIADLQKEKEEKQKIKEEAFHNQNQQKLLEKQAKVNKIVESYRKEEKAKQIIAESRKS